MAGDDDASSLLLLPTSFPKRPSHDHRRIAATASIHREARHDNIDFDLCVAPWVLGIIAFTFRPMLYSLYIRFTEWGMLKTHI